jgi:hypothetical protein
MTRKQTLSRILAAALATSALAAPAAGARPVDVQPIHVKHAVSQVAPNARGTNVAAPDQQAPAIHQDLRSADAIDAGDPGNPQPVRSAPVRAVDGDGGSTPWLTIGLAFAGCLALAGTAATAGRIRRRGVAA